ncbi:hypothetical protein [Sporosarcina sp. Te-1]|uniref:hypothetical protein n=1 Tax=Sporosarcina sp. Te-1 TaxID=2818390 RepID=UPI001A9CE47D|nr:hypothetical protein [Sporosarcina sp. Te-1]QTD39666.1 hypothetical protein J3U78_12495 [Sporosarcina sp. Te-1]
MKYTLWIALLLTIIGGVSGYYFQDMFYWAGHSFFWFNIGAALAFLCSLIAVGLVIYTHLKKGFTTRDMLLLVIILPVAIGTLFWTTFVYAMWHG